jgi:(2Fe-2S) ferredoxin
MKRSAIQGNVAPDSAALHPGYAVTPSIAPNNAVPRSMPKPAKHVFVCTQQRPPGHPRSSCAQAGCAAVYEEFLWQLQQRNLFASVQVTATGCMGPCSEGPSVLVYPEGVMYAKLKQGDVARIFDSRLVGGEPVAELKVAPEFW